MVGGTHGNLDVSRWVQHVACGADMALFARPANQQNCVLPPLRHVSMLFAFSDRRHPTPMPAPLAILAGSERGKAGLRNPVFVLICRWG